MKSVLWHFGINNNYATFGQNLLSICYDKNNLSKSKLAVHYSLTVILKYLRDVGLLRFTKYGNISKLLTFVEEILIYASVLNFFTFLKTGRKPSLTDFVLNIDHITMYGNKRRNIGYTHMTRELLWGGFMVIIQLFYIFFCDLSILFQEFLAFTVSIVNYHSLSRKITNPFSSKSNLKQSTKQVVLQMSTKCEYCHEKPILPHRVACEHVFCYYCLKVVTFFTQT